MSINPQKDFLNRKRRKRIAAEKLRHQLPHPTPSQVHPPRSISARQESLFPQRRKHRWVRTLLAGLAGAFIAVIVIVTVVILILSRVVSTAVKTIPTNPVAPFAQGQVALPEIQGVQCQEGIAAYTTLASAGTKDVLVQGDGWIYADDGTVHSGNNTCSTTDHSMKPAIQVIHKAGGKAYGLLTMYVPLHPDPSGYWTMTDAAKYLDAAVNSSKRTSYIENIVTWAKAYDGIVVYLLRVDTSYHDAKGFPTSHLFTVFCQEIRKFLPRTEGFGVALVGKTSDTDPGFQDWEGITSPLSKLTPSDPAINPDLLVMVAPLPSDQPGPTITVSLLEKELDYARDNNMYPLAIAKIRWEFPLEADQWTASCDSAANWTYDGGMTTQDLNAAMKDPNFLQAFDHRGDKEKPEFWYGGYSQTRGCVIHRVFFNTSKSLNYIYSSFKAYLQKEIGVSVQIALRYADTAAPLAFWK